MKIIVLNNGREMSIEDFNDAIHMCCTCRHSKKSIKVPDTLFCEFEHSCSKSKNCHCYYSFSGIKDISET